MARLENDDRRARKRREEEIRWRNIRQRRIAQKARRSATGVTARDRPKSFPWRRVAMALLVAVAGAIGIFSVAIIFL
jgi:hypothetical protein